MSVVEVVDVAAEVAYVNLVNKLFLGSRSSSHSTFRVWLFPARMSHSCAHSTTRAV